MGLMLLQLACVALVILRHGTDADMTGFAKPVLGGAVTTGVTTGLQSVATVVIDDGTVAGTTITTVEGVSGNSGTIVYSLTDNDFEIDPSSGAVKTKAAYTVNYGTKSSFTLTVTAVDANTDVTATLTLTVTVIENDPPTFTSPTLCWEIASNAPAGTTVGTYTASAGAVGTAITSYAIDSGNTDTDFTATMANGVLVTAKTPLGSPTYILVIQAVDDGEAPATGSISVIIRRMADGATLQECINGVSGIVGSLIVVLTALTAKFM